MGWTLAAGVRKIEDLPDFSSAEFTVVVSDLHLCEEEPLNPRFPLWKKYKTRQFFFDSQFRDFLHHIDHKSSGRPIELILNGDIFDFDSVTGLPDKPPYRISWLEKRRGLHPKEEKSRFKIRRILQHHQEWVEALRWFIERGHRVIFIIGNHDLELHFESVQKAVVENLELSEEGKQRVRFNEWFYISNKDTMIEHGNQYDPYCVAQDPVNPFVQRFNSIEVRVPFGNLATRYMINGMGFFNPHVDTNFIMSSKEYVLFFFKYMLLAQPFLLVTWLWGATIILVQSFFDRLLPEIKNPLTIEDRVDYIAAKSNATPRMVRELKDLFVPPASSYPLLIARELWLDRAFLLLLVAAGSFQIFLFINNVYEISLFWMFIPFGLFLPFFLFYSGTIYSEVMESKEPQERILSMTSLITGVRRVIYGHTHIVRHEIIGPVEHLNSGTWSPAFRDVECEQPIDSKTFVWIHPDEKGGREAKLLQYKDGREYEVFSSKQRPTVPHKSVEPA